MQLTDFEWSRAVMQPKGLKQHAVHTRAVQQLKVKYSQNMVSLQAVPHCCAGTMRGLRTVHPLQSAALQKRLFCTPALQGCSLCCWLVLCLLFACAQAAAAVAAAVDAEL